MNFNQNLQRAEMDEIQHFTVVLALEAFLAASTIWLKPTAFFLVIKSFELIEG